MRAAWHVWISLYSFFLFCVDKWNDWRRRSLSFSYTSCNVSHNLFAFVLKVYRSKPLRWNGLTFYHLLTRLFFVCVCCCVAHSSKISTPYSSSTAHCMQYYVPFEPSVCLEYCLNRVPHVHYQSMSSIDFFKSVFLALFPPPVCHIEFQLSTYHVQFQLPLLYTFSAPCIQCRFSAYHIQRKLSTVFLLHFLSPLYPVYCSTVSTLCAVSTLYPISDWVEGVYPIVSIMNNTNMGVITVKHTFYTILKCLRIDSFST
jgi:hypothetical protein